MREFPVEIYIETSLKGHTQNGAAGKWLVVFTKRNGEPEKREGILWKEKATENSLTLELLRDALAILTKNCSIQVNTRCGHIFGAINSHWVEKWERTGWVNAKGEPVKNVELWQQVYDLMGKHSLKVVSAPHDHQSVMQNDIREEMNRHYGKRPDK